MECWKDMGIQKRHSQFGDTKFMWRTVLLLGFCVSCTGQESRVEIDPYLLNKTLGLTELSGGVLTGGRTLWKADGSPYLLRDDLLVEREAELLIEPGVEVRFAPMIGITVRGKLLAVGQHGNKITFTSTEERQSPKPFPDIRLVDGPSILAGRVQLLHRGQWRSVCTNSRNWTVNDMETACRQLGFMGGTFYNWVDRQPGRRARLLFEEPKCKGTEYDLFQCDWQSRQLGSGVCDYHPDLAIQCLPHHDDNELRNYGVHWRGIRFEHAVYERILTAENTLYVPTSMSRLSHIIVKNAGLGRDNNATSALDVIGVPPVMEDIEISNSAFNAINVTSPNAPIVINNCTIQNNRGYGVYVNSTYGMARIENCLIHDNGGDGVKYVVHEMNIDERFDRAEVFDLCTLASTPSQTFPIVMSLEQSRYSNMERDCHQKFYTRPDHVLTLSFIKILTNRNDTGHVYIYDGLTVDDKLLMSFSIKNHTRPQSITSTRSRMYVRFHADTRTDITGFVRLTSGISKTYDLNVTDSIISDNNGRGVAIENLRSQIHVHRTSISNNNHVAGLQVVNGAGDINVTESRISFNQGDGINVTVTGGNRNISRSIISSNQRYGIAVWINTTQETEYIPTNQTTVVEYSEIFKNLDIGILHGNFCGDSWVNVTGNWFNSSVESTIDIATCWLRNDPVKLLNLQIGHNRFYQNLRVPIKIQPALNVMGRIEYNYFEHGDYGAIVILNRVEGKYIEEFEKLPSRFLIQHNYFFGNRGPFVVNLGLSPYSDMQYILFSRNYLRDNKIREQFESIDGTPQLTPRSRVAAAIVLASSNIDVFRNIINNPEAQYEIGSHVEDQSKILNCTYNWLGFGEEEKVYNRLFHRKDRFNLAKIIYMPYLLHSSNPGATQINYNSLYVPQFNVPGSNIVGGEVEGIEILRQGEYDVVRDINIRPGGKLILQSGVTLKFPPAIGIMVAGKLDARGKRPNDISFTLKEEIIMTNDTIYETDPEIDSTTPGYLEPVVPIRLLGGRTQYEGRLQVRLEGKWGTVCNYKWNIINAALVCNQLGLALNPDDWFLEPNEIPSAGITEDIVLSNVECTEFDNDITKCKAETVDSFENSCTHENDVGIRCYETSWAGMRFSVLAERADLQYVTIEKAGLLDYSSNLFKPALQIDFARHGLESVRIVNNHHDGLGILYSDLYGADAINTVRNSEFSNNKGSGISLRQLGLKVYSSIIENNKKAGIFHNPHLTGPQQRELAGWFNLDPSFNMDESSYRPILIPEYQTDISLANGETRHIVFTKQFGENIVKTYNIKCNPGYVLGLQLLNPIHNFSTESICIYDSQNIHEGSTIWCLDRDLSTFPTTSNSFGIVLKYESGMNALGGVVLVVSTIVAPVQNIRNRIIKGPVPTLQVTNTKIKGNTKGIKALYYNRYLNEIGDHFLRKANETIKIVNCEIAHNKEEAMYINTPFWDIHESNITEITLMINSSLITDNGKGIYHFARDLRSSNNLYHYVLQDNTFERNMNGGFDISLPYVWQYNENFTHSVFMNNNTWRNNHNFGLVIDGHFAEVNLTKNIFTDNVCRNGLISIRGMEKKMKIDGNFIEKNNGQYMVQFYMDSQSEIMGFVYAVFVYNQLKNNRFTTHKNRGAIMKSTDPTYVIGFKGIQKVKVTRNLFGNNGLKYTLVAGIKTAKINNLLDVTENWWGSADEKDIRNQIFDFDDWNNHAIATYLPYLLEDSFDSSVSVTFSPETAIDINELGGRFTSDLTLDARLAPYVVKSDITVMPDVTLTINPGVILEFAPNVGILVMGTLNAIGQSQLPIFMRPITTPSDTENRIEKRETGQYSPDYVKHRQQRQLETLILQDSIRLCTGRNCSVSDNSFEKKNEGFLEYYNKTTLQWVPMCDGRFTERNAQVVCRELGFDPINIFFAHDRRVEYHSSSLSRIWSWPEPLQCVGTENRYEDCPIRLNGQLYGHRHECKWNSDFIFIHCGNRNLEENLDYWGGIRFANPEFEYSLYEHRIHDHHTHETMKKKESTLRNIQIIGAGILHNEKSPAIQSIIRNPHIQNVNITKCAYHGINIVSPTDTIDMMFNSVVDILGEGVNAISLTGEGRESEESSFTPLKDLNLPYHLFSLIDICDSTKVVTVEERVILYYKYDNNPVNCVKIFKSTFRVKPFGFRLLQFNLFNHTLNYGKRDSITLYDGDIYNITAPQIGYLENGSLDEKKLFSTDGASLSVKLFANGASSVHGFIAEIITLPISAIGLNRDVQHNISSSVFTKNRDGAINYQSVGEVNPFVAVIRNEFNDNCLKLYGNFTTCQAVVRVDVQNTQTFVFRNNLVRNNVGGLLVRADSRGSATSLRGWIHNNLFFGNHDLPCLQLEGRQSSPYQEVTIYRNYFTRNRVRYKDVIVLRQVVSNFTHNYVHDNTGMRILEVSGFDKVRLPIYQTTSHNGFYKNYALDRDGRATVVAGTAGQHYVDNIFFNPDNDYEMITVNRSIFFDYNPNAMSALDLWRTRIDAKHNYWSYNESFAVAGRIRDQSDNPLLLEVDYRPYYMNNLTVLGGGKCPPGWDAVAGTCYMYVGAPMTYEEARQFCLSDNASMPYVSGNYEALYEFIQRQNQWFQYGDRVWVNHIDYVTQCTSFAFSSVEITDCNQKNAFICEIDPKITIDPLSWQGDALAVAFIGVLAAAVLLVILALICWYSKSKHRHLQRLERRNSIRQSLHSVRSIGSINGGFPDNTYRRKLTQMSARSTDTLTKGSDYKKMLASTTSMESMEKSQFNSSLEDTQSFDIYEAHNPNNIIQLKHSTFNKKPASPEYSVPQNVNINRPYNLAYRNEGFRDNSGATSGAPSMNTVTTEELPIIHHPGGLSPEDTLSPQSDRDPYYTSDTLPLRGQTEDPLALKRELEREGKIYGYGAPNYEAQPKLSFLMELRSRMPEETPQHSTTTFGQQTATEPQKYYEEDLPSPPPVYSNYERSYDSSPQTSHDFDYSPELHTRSRSEAILETNFDLSSDNENHLSEADRSHSQPLETAM